MNSPLQKQRLNLVVVLALLICYGSALDAGVGRLTVVSKQELGSGVRYVKYISKGRRPVTVHTVYYDCATAGTAVRVIKAGSNTTERQSVVDMASYYQERNKNSVLALVNANFWSAGRGNPIGPCVIDGEVVEMSAYKHWSSAFFDVENKVTIDTFRLTASLTYNNQTLSIESANRRISDTALVMYNAFCGGTVPYVSPATVSSLYSQMLIDSSNMVGDSTEKVFDTLALQQEIERARLEADVEHTMVKIQLTYVGQPSINKALPCVVLAVADGKVPVPKNGCVVSVPKTSAIAMPAIGDTVVLLVQTNVLSGKRFMNAVCGTPRLVRNGKAKHEAKAEGVTGRRFIRQRLARTCIGTDKKGQQLILTTIEPTNRAQRRVGATLAETAQIMKMVGAYQAMNLDGGGSAGMVVTGNHVFFDGLNPKTRSVSVGLAIVQLANVLRHYPR